MQNVISGNYAERAVLANESLLPSTGNACFSRADGGLGLVRGYVTSVGAGKQLVSNSHLSNFSSVLANPRVRRFFSSQAPKKKSKWIMSVFCFCFCFFGSIVSNALTFCVRAIYIYIYLVDVDYQNYYPKDKKEIPKANEQKSESKGTFLLVLVLCALC